tara:strand:+ start:394 stop:1044 length:651 start_codon:yes stop_codon:yes gene_type:complete
MYYMDEALVFNTLPDGEFFHTITCLEAEGVAFVTVVGDTFLAIDGLISGPPHTTDFLEVGSYGYAQRLSGKLIENDFFLKNSVTGTFTASQSGGTVAANTITVTRAGVDVTASVTPPEFDGITTNGSGVMTAIKPTDTVGADLQVGDVLTFEVIVSGASIGDATLTLEPDNIDLNSGIYKKAKSKYQQFRVAAGQTITGRFTSVLLDNGPRVIAYK